MSAIVKSEQQTVDSLVFSREQIDIIKNTIAKGCSDAELDVFAQTCKRLRLDPFARQIFLVKRWDSQANAMVAAPQVSIDGFRLVADRTREYRGQTAPQWCGRDGKWVDVWLSDQPPAAARVGVYREGFAEPLVRVARYDSYVQTTKDKQTGEMRPNAMWQRMPDVMLSKCCESLALRAAFPNELSGVYTSDEMPSPEHDADGVVVSSATVPAEKLYTFEQHLANLERIGADKLQGWVSKLFTMRRTAEQDVTAWSAFTAKCEAAGKDPTSYLPKDGSA